MILSQTKPSASEAALTSGTDLYPFEGAAMLRNHAAHMHRIRRMLELSRCQEASTRIMRRNV